MKLNYLIIRALMMWCALAPLNSCIDDFVPEVAEPTKDILVVSGFINSNGFTTIKLSRTQNLSQSNTPPAETKATVYIEQEAGTRYSLTEKEAGVYFSTSLQLNAGRRYRLYIKTSTGQEYASDFASIKATPVIDDISWKTDAAGLQVYVNTHDANNQTRYYRWEYEETWQFTSFFQSGLEYKNGKMESRLDDIYHCWGNEKSTAIKISNTARLSQDMISNYLLTSLPATSGKLRYRYSILVKQYAQTQEEYQYWENLRKNTESIGTIFDPLPTQLTGNIHNLNNESEPVIGFVGVCSVEQKRIFIGNEEIPRNWRFITGYEKCIGPDTIALNAIAIFNSPNYVPVYTVYIPMTSIITGYAGGTTECVDCRRRGTNVKPDFWR